MVHVEVEFGPDERALLDWLQAHVQLDRALPVSDTRLITELKLTEDPPRFFMAKMRLVAAGVIAMFVDGQGRQLLQLNMPEREKAERSRRYVFTIVPLEMMRDISQQVRRYRMQARKAHAENKATAELAPKTAEPSKPLEKAVKPLEKPKPKPDFQAVQARAQNRLGVRPTTPLRPPLKRRETAPVAR